MSKRETPLTRRYWKSVGIRAFLVSIYNNTFLNITEWRKK